MSKRHGGLGFPRTTRSWCLKGTALCLQARDSGSLEPLGLGVLKAPLVYSLLGTLTRDAFRVLMPRRASLEYPPDR